MTKADEELLSLRRTEMQQRNQVDQQHIQQMDRALSLNERVVFLNEQSHTVHVQELAVSQRICDNDEIYQREMIRMKQEELDQNRAFLNLMTEMFRQANHKK